MDERKDENYIPLGINAVGIINLAIVFLFVRSTKSGFYGQIIASRYMHLSLEKEFLIKQIKNDQSQHVY